MVITALGPQNLGYGMDRANLVETHGSSLSQMPSIRFAKRTEDIFTSFLCPLVKTQIKAQSLLTCPDRDISSRP